MLIIYIYTCLFFAKGFTIHGLSDRSVAETGIAAQMLTEET